MKPYPCIESTIHMTRGNITVRMWINRVDLPVSLQEELAEVVENVEDLLLRNLGHRALVIALGAIRDLNAVQVLEHEFRAAVTDLGTVIYTVPFEDVHG